MRSGTREPLRIRNMRRLERVADQHAGYVIKQRTIYQRTEQRPAGAAMKALTDSLSRQNRETVAAYLQEMASM